ncbi:TlpA family protein disulfide reductase [Chitinophaga rhizosphaerae]|uniref:TlpA family protein disulfide reductase n=1 Tax=Chitinophaga rhizosphaerae TaxID=1864947 RepID=UPI000F80D96B|nr:TlpA disulfide reductase family protein [Chitinophaga rhizosphaerae]
MIRSLQLLLLLCLSLPLLSQQTDNRLQIKSRQEAPPFGPLRFREDSVTIIGEYKNFSGGAPFTIIYTNWVTRNQVTYSTPIDASGKFRITFPLPAESSILLDWGRANLGNVGVPGETIYLYADAGSFPEKKPEDAAGKAARANKATIRYEGINARLHNEIHRYLEVSQSLKLPEYWDFNWGRQFKTMQQYSDTMVGLFRVKMQHFENYDKQHKLEARTRQFIEARIRYDIGSRLTQQYFMMPGKDKYQIDDTFFETIDTIASQRFGTGYLSDDYLIVIDNIRDHSESKARALKLNADSIYEARYRHPIEKILTDTWETSSKFSQGFVYSDSMLRALRKNVTDTFLMTRLSRQNDSLKALDANDALVADTRFVTEFPVMQTAAEIFRHVTAPYKGKVIYLDIWGTWCPPCRKMMELMPDIKKEYAGKDVVFLYLANHSPEAAWKNAIRQHKITGPTVVHYRMPDMMQQVFERQYLNGGYPSYLLIDKEGNLVTKQAPWPRDPKSLREAINKLL